MYEKTETRFLGSVITAVSAIALLFAVSAANAAEAVGQIKSVDKASRTLILTNGSIFQLAQNVKIGTLRPGQSVKVSFEMSGGRKIAETVTPAK